MKNKIIKNHLFSNYLSILILLFCFLQLSVQGVVYINKNATGTNNGNSWINAYTTNQAGINDADVADEEVWVAQGTYPEAIEMKSGVKLYGGFNGTETELNQRNWTTNVTTIDGSTARGGSPAYHVVIMYIITNATIDGFSITGGNANGGGINDFGGGIFCYNLNDTNLITNNKISGNSANQYGGGISCDSSLPAITNNTIFGNSAYYGSGISCYDNSSPDITNNTISGNSATYTGGGISCHWSSSPQISNNIISGNSSNYGGGISCNSSSSPQISNNIISGNSGPSNGGGIFCWDNSSPQISNNTISGNSDGGILCWDNSSPAITNNTISGNSAYWGGGIYCSFYSSPAITNNIISGNSANDSGGGISCNFYSSPTITNNTISGNSAYYGGGIYCGSLSPAITNNIISGNSANDSGGGIYCNSYTSPQITNNTISGNSAGSSGGGIFCCNYSSPQIRNTIFYSNNKYDIYEAYLDSDPTVSYNDIYGNPDGIYFDEGTTPYTSVAAMDTAIPECSNNIGLNPLFVSDTLSGGSWTATPVYNSSTFQTTLTNSSAAWIPNEHSGRLLNPDTTQNLQFVIVSNTVTTMTVWGNITTVAHSGDAYKIFDYHLQLASPCIDAGYDQDVPDTDFDSEPRPMDVLGIDNNGLLAEYDIGADEYNPTTTLADTVWEFYQ